VAVNVSKRGVDVPEFATANPKLDSAEGVFDLEWI
jgi:hypothetical protein